MTARANSTNFTQKFPNTKKSVVDFYRNLFDAERNPYRDNSCKRLGKEREDLLSRFAYNVTQLLSYNIVL